MTIAFTAAILIFIVNSGPPVSSIMLKNKKGRATGKNEDRSLKFAGTVCYYIDNLPKMHVVS